MHLLKKKNAKNINCVACTHSIMARAILHTYLTCIALNSDTLGKDRQLIVKKCPYLVQEMVPCVHQLLMLIYVRKGKYINGIYINLILKFFFLSAAATKHWNYWKLQKMSPMIIQARAAAPHRKPLSILHQLRILNRPPRQTLMLMLLILMTRILLQ